MGKEYVFDDILHRKTVVLDNKNIDVKKSKNYSFPKTWYKTFHLIILDKIRKKNVFDDILYRKIAFLDYFWLFKNGQKIARYQNEVKCSAFDMKMIFILVQIKLIFTRKVVRLASIWKWGFLELGSGLL